jgi:hypothetical protein
MTRLVAVSRRQILVDALAGTGGMSLLLSAAAAVPARAAAPVGNTLPTGDVHDFDFFVGTWNIVNRRLKKRWAGSDDWEVFPATFRSENRLGGVVNIDEGVFPTKGWSGVTLRTFSLDKRQWFIYWISSRSGDLNPPWSEGSVAIAANSMATIRTTAGPSRPASCTHAKVMTPCAGSRPSPWTANSGRRTGSWSTLARKAELDRERLGAAPP